MTNKEALTLKQKCKGPVEVKGFVDVYGVIFPVCCLQYIYGSCFFMQPDQKEISFTKTTFFIAF